MKQNILISTLVGLLAGSLFVNFMGNANARNSRAIDMTGDKNATWILTDDDLLLVAGISRSA